MRINYRKVIPQIALALILLFFFFYDIQFWAVITGKTIANSCILPPLQKIQCSTKPIKVGGNKALLIGLPNKTPEFKFTVNRTPDEINKNDSYFLLEGSNGAIEGEADPEKVFTMFAYVKILDKAYFTDSDVTINDLGNGSSEVVFHFNKTFNMGYTATATMNIVDVDGRAGYGWMDTTTAKNVFDFFIGSFGYLFQFLIWYVAIFGNSFKTTTWSTIYNSESKEPVLGTVVRIFQGSALIGSFVTGETGVLYTKLKKGVYKLMITHSQYKFPSKLSPLASDGEYKNLYYGGDIDIKKDNSNLKINIPLDPTQTEMKTNFVKKASMAFATTIDAFNPVLIIFMVVVQAVVWPTYYETWLFAVIGIGLLALQQYQKNKYKKTPGMIMDEQGNRLTNLKINLYEGQWNRLVDTKIANEKGEYEFIIPNGNYYLKLDNNAYTIQGADAEGKYILQAKNVNAKVLYVNEKLVLSPASTQTVISPNIEPNTNPVIQPIQ